MAKRGVGYGSEFHLLDHRRHHPAVLDGAILRALARPAATLEWVCPREATVRGREPQGISFVGALAKVRQRWKAFWPQRGRQASWDGVARLTEPDLQSEWLLFEGKGNHPEFCTPPCGAGKQGRKTIEAAMNATKRYLGVHRFFPWLGTYYQHANRLACLYFLNREGVPARLLEIFFCGDQFPDGTRCPRTEEEWRPLLRARELTLGLPDEHALSARIHQVFLPVIRVADRAKTDRNAVGVRPRERAEERGR